MTVGDVRAVFDQAYPPHLAESWDAVGLVCGDPNAEVRHVAFALDCTDAVAAEAVARGADMLVVHHPLLLRGVTSIAADTPKGKVLHRLLTGGVALFAAHTNADAARPGVNDQLATTLGLIPGAPLAPKPADGVDLWGVHVPAGAVDAVQEAIFAAGGGTIGDYSECAYRVEGTGQFTPQPGAHPTAGTIGERHTTDETRISFVAPAARRAAIRAAILDSHPYEEPAYDCVAQVAHAPSDVGIGRVCTLPEPMTLAEFTQQVADRLPSTVWGVRAAGDPEAIIRTVAVASGSGDSFLDTVRSLGVDCFVSSDLRHHPVDEFLRAGGPAVIDTAHWASEFPWVYQAQQILQQQLPGVETSIIELRTDPWVLSAH
ncbi:Nif3-like dinuclear metal center hexameric protein [Corynebacterium sp. 13CS0277]|uniref:Nif3-like dinuclear metal center hexameric protein n=1 Tax=Corynebacterium sp. 13CS0277 TaxID=2071994 RepID=UPI000D026AB9|nr:Nif3-like dinuclear metal center hexameric protein [Corynebacterium sp. 13CS0277]PRQ10723.1 Nif3-like dinuclear metal center hexameric protein [Corynebacterium sp. 13CS0277]